MVVTKENMNDIVPLSKLGKECGVDYFVVKPCSDTFDSRLDSPKGEYIEALDIFKEAEQYSNEKYTVNVKWKKVLNGGWKDYDLSWYSIYSWPKWKGRCISLWSLVSRKKR